MLPYAVLVVIGHAIFATFEFKRWDNFQKKGEVSSQISCQSCHCDMLHSLVAAKGNLFSVPCSDSRCACT